MTFPGAQRRSEVSIGLPGSGAGFNNQRLRIFNRLCYGNRHLSLWFARFKTGYRFGQLAICCKIVRHTAPVNLHRDYVRVERLTPVTEVTAAPHCGSLEPFKWKANEELVMSIVRIDAEDRWSDVVIYNNTLWYTGVPENTDADAFEQTANTLAQIDAVLENRAPVSHVFWMPLFS